MNESPANVDAIPRKRAGKNALEWAVFAASCLLVAGTIGVLVYEMIRWEGRPARVSATLGTVRAEGDRTWIPVEVRNDGDKVAEAVEIKVSTGDGAEKEEAIFTVDHLPRLSVRKGQVSFEGLPEGRVFEVRIDGYEEP